MLEEFMDVQANVIELLKKVIEDDKLSHAYLIDTNGYSDAYNFVLAFSKMIICNSHYINNSKCDNCNICKRIDSGNYLELKLIEADGIWIKKEQLMELQENFSKKGIEGNRRIYIIKDCDKMNIQTANSILKFLEEPTDNITAILMTNNVGKVLDTIVSRCQLIKLNNNRNIEDSTIKKMADLIVSDNKEKQAFINDSENIELIDNLINFVEEFENKKTQLIIETKKIWHNYFKDRFQVDLAIDMLINFYYDVLLNLTNNKTIFFTDYEDEVKKISKFNDIYTTINKLDVLIDAKNVLKYNLNLNLFIDKLIIDMVGVGDKNAIDWCKN